MDIIILTYCRLIYDVHFYHHFVANLQFFLLPLKLRDFDQVYVDYGDPFCSVLLSYIVLCSASIKC